jgi:hypothetical protein
MAEKALFSRIGPQILFFARLIMPLNFEVMCFGLESLHVPARYISSRNHAVLP